jgi:hypothetical protein
MPKIVSLRLPFSMKKYYYYRSKYFVASEYWWIWLSSMNSIFWKAIDTNSFISTTTNCSQDKAKVSTKQAKSIPQLSDLRYVIVDSTSVQIQ